MESEVFERYKKAGGIAAQARELARSLVEDGYLLYDLADNVEREIKRLGAGIAFPVNVAIDNIAAHYTPGSTDKSYFKTGQLVKIDIGAHVDGYIADTTFTKEVGTDRWQKLIRSSEDALEAAINVTRPGIKAKMIGAAIGRTIESYGYSPITNLTGHLLEKYNLHAGLSIPNVMDDTGQQVKEGMAIAIEPFATNGAGRVAGNRSGNIYRLVRQRKMDDPELDRLIEKAHATYRGLPFSERWMAKELEHEKVKKKIRRLLKFGVISTYPILYEVEKGMVSQAEHTVVVQKDGCFVTTR